ncbi:MAG: hypothetical protein DI586_05610 [Micavibrio aeruginosavorus]|uniref:Membrane protein 6-pyruvoyl-tetrahydropterin synthase-related domain-containing protein n=1 Tax=Micavibrio aeruginosavorus TaxID=349221 RepID=A0A2W5FPR5_9BACT|nr:MAG: hypothetical protein DI586_05610 [Micavibrio aeruginosavorus]
MNFFSRFTVRHLCYFSLALILILFMPSIWQGLKNSHDIRFHTTWFMSFKDAFYSGVIYPRWLGDQFAGLGAPTFYFYPPLTTYFFIATDLLTLRLLPEDHVIAIAGFLMSIISALTFHTWIKHFTEKRIAVLGSLFYAVAPYHLMIDYYNRSAMAEYAAYMWIPLIFTGIYNIIRRSPTNPLSTKWVAILALSLSALFLTHLLTTLIIAPVCALYALLLLKDHFAKEGEQTIPKILLMAFAGITGIGITALYLVPALTMMDHINTPALRRYNPENNYIFKAITSPSGKDHFLLKIFVAATIHLALCIYLGVEAFIARRNGTPKMKHHGLLLIGSAIATYALMNGIGGKILFTEPSPYREIQFPWRLMVLLEFVTISGCLMIAQNFISPRQMKRATGVIIAALIILIGMQGFDIYNRAWKKRESDSILISPLLSARISSEEYLPAGTDFPRPHLDMQPILNYGAKAEQAVITKGNGAIKAINRDGTTFTMEIEAKTPVEVMLHQFYFPGWTATTESGDIIQITPYGKDKLLAFSLSSGEHKITVKRMAVAQEKTGGLISAISLLVFILGLVWIKRLKKAKRSK